MMALPLSSSSSRINLPLVLLLFLLSSSFCRGDYSSGSVFGLESPIELIEEWGCQDVPIRLTCPRLDSKIVVLEATFSPNCSDSKNCHVFDSHGRLTRVLLKHSRHDYRLQETAAGRRFLQTLRKSQEDYRERKNGDEGEAIEPPSSSAPFTATSLWDTVDQDDTLELKSSLERLIVEYLKKLSPEEDFETEEYSRLRRHLMDIIEPTIDKEEGDEVEEEVEEYSSNEIVVPEEEEDDSQVEFSDNNHNNNGGSEVAQQGPPPRGKRRRVSKKCAHSRRVVSSLNALEIEKAQHNETEKEYNIRRIINYRCSGKNHCNFLFEQDHPFSLIWRSGIVRIKYACMNEFRITKYCGEILPIGNERRFDDPSFAASGKDTSEPIMAARMQLLNDQSFHQFTNLKIIKADEKEPKKRRKLAPPKKTEEKEEEEEPQHKDPSVYSQDFRTLKILPADTINFNEIELIGEDFYFGDKLQNEDEFSHSPATTTTTTTSTTSTTVVDDSETFEIPPSNDVRIPTTLLTDLFDNEIIELQENQTAGSFERNFEENYLMGAHRSTIPDVQYLDNLVIGSTVTIPGLREGGEEDDTVNSSGGQDTFDEVEEEEEDEDDDDYYYDDEYEILQRNKGQRKYKSIARTQLRKPLLQGFIMSPGYPKYYIGEMECRFIIKAPKFHQIRITLFDVSLRSDLPCRDFVDIDDVVQRRSLYSGCQEQSRPVSVVTQHIARIRLTTTTKTAYPKRGVLIHYQAVGCVQPELPRNVVLVENNPEEGSLKVACKHPDFVFPDTNYPERMLHCSPTHVAWDRSIPQCIELEQASGSGLVSHLNSELLSSSIYSGSASSGAAMNKPADVVVDVIVPCVIIGALFLVNGLIMMMIMRRRNQSNSGNTNPRELEDM